ncbi:MULTISPECIES: hypothetical protein [Lentibacillus]|uniref:LURP-one-related family protein n=2 Tax=Lentibacillus TaxID=175304 RepID=A0A4Y9ADF1_9BACI|nr:hypothetical protein [Lentibacillus salicampi]TFJ93137.1 hypothetical protein E4U82_08700 [Lentibacillus salicampi]
MIITFKRPMFMTKKYLDVHQDAKKIGKMRYWRQGNSHNAKYDVNIEMLGFDKTYEITQQYFTIRDGVQWDVLNNGNLIAKMSTGKGLLAKDGVGFQLLNEEMTLAIEAKAFKTEGHLMLDNEHIGKTKAKGLFFNSRYVVDVFDSRLTLEPILLAGVVYAFWAASNQR